MALLILIVIKKSNDWLTVLTYDNHGGGLMLLTQDHGTRCAIGLLCNIEHKLTSIRPDEITEKTRIKGNRTSNILTG